MNSETKKTCENRWSGEHVSGVLNYFNKIILLKFYKLLINFVELRTFVDKRNIFFTCDDTLRETGQRRESLLTTHYSYQTHRFDLSVRPESTSSDEMRRILLSSLLSVCVLGKIIKH